MVVVARDTSAAIDVAGGWDVSLPLDVPGGVRRMMVEQTGNALDVTMDSSPFLGHATGSIDPETRAFHVGDPAFTGIGFTQSCDQLRIDAVVSPDGSTMTGDATYTQGFFHSCPFQSGTFTATRTPCGNGVVDAGESCDPGDIFSNTDCCSRTCSFEPATVSCASSAQAAMWCLPYSQCSGSSAVCEAPPFADLDGDGIPDSCDSCNGGPGVSTIRLHRGHGVTSIVARVDVSAEGIDPVASGVDIGFRGGPTGDSWVWLFPGASTHEGGGWKVKRPGRLWRFHAVQGGVVATVRARRGHVIVRLRVPDTAAPALASPARFVSVGFGLAPSLRPCGEIDVSASTCVARRHTTVCR